jgi:hypothetical protein
VIVMEVILKVTLIVEAMKTYNSIPLLSNA